MCKRIRPSIPRAQGTVNAFLTASLSCTGFDGGMLLHTAVRVRGGRHSPDLLAGAERCTHTVMSACARGQARGQARALPYMRLSALAGESEAIITGTCTRSRGANKLVVVIDSKCRRGARVVNTRRA